MLVEILERVKLLENKIDSLSLLGNAAPSQNGAVDSGPLVSSPTAILGSDTIGPLPFPSLAPPESARSVVGSSAYRYVSGAHQMLGWPAIQQLLESLGPMEPGMNHANIEYDGPAIILGLHHSKNRLPSEPAGPMILIDPAPHTAFTIAGPRSAGGLPLATSALTWDSMQKLSSAYFDTFNFVYPIMDRQSFVTDIMTPVFNGGFQDGISSILAFLVFALGEVALAGIQGVPNYTHGGRLTGLKGGSAVHPPGLALFNEARKRMGFSLGECSLENVQIFALAGYVQQPSNTLIFCLSLTKRSGCTAALALTIW